MLAIFMLVQVLYKHENPLVQLFLALFGLPSGHFILLPSCWWSRGRDGDRVLLHVPYSSAEEGRQNLYPVFAPAQQGFFMDAVASKVKKCDAMVDLPSQGWFPLARRTAVPILSWVAQPKFGMLLLWSWRQMLA